LPTFDVVSEVNMHEVTNALDQTNKEISTRFDLKDSGSKCTLAENVIQITSDAEFHLEQVVQVLKAKLAKRGVDLRSLEEAKIQVSGSQARQSITLRQGLDSTLAKKIVKLIKDSKLKTQATIQEDKVRVTGKKRDDLQEAIALLKEAKVELPLQFNNFRD